MSKKGRQQRRAAVVQRPGPTKPVRGAGNSRWDALLALERAQGDVDRVTKSRDRAVQLARSRGSSWVDIGQAVGVTRQAARQRWGRVDAGGTDLG